MKAFLVGLVLGLALAAWLVPRDVWLLQEIEEQELRVPATIEV